MTGATAFTMLMREWIQAEIIFQKAVEVKEGDTPGGFFRKELWKKLSGSFFRLPLI